MPGRIITALFSREPDARRAADAVRALGYGDGRAMLARWDDLAEGPSRAGAREAGAGLVLVVTPDAEDEDKLVGVIDHYQPERLVCEGEAGRPGAEGARPDARPAGPEAGRPSATARLRAAAAALRGVHGGKPPAASPEREAAEDRALEHRTAEARDDKGRRSLPETEAGG